MISAESFYTQTSKEDLALFFYIAGESSAMLQATIMTDPGTADRTYIGPMTPELVEEIIAKVLLTLFSKGVPWKQQIFRKSSS